MTMNFIGTGTRLKDEDLPRAGKLIGVGEDEIHAILDVETSGSGYDSQKRLKMLFEPHVFYRELTDLGERDRAAKAGLAYRKWGEKPYPKDSYPILQKAMGVNKEAALRSASWGLGQIMGFNHALAGYASAEAMVEAFKKSEGAQLIGMVNFIKACGLDKAMRDRDWATFAHGYNGPSYVKHGYHIKLAQRFAWWQTKPDTPLPPVEAEEKKCIG